MYKTVICYFFIMMCLISHSKSRETIEQEKSNKISIEEVISQYVSKIDKDFQEIKESVEEIISEENYYNLVSDYP